MLATTATIAMVALFATLPAPRPALALVPPPPADPTPLSAPITEVVVYGSAARVHRSAELPGGGLFVVQGLPGLIAPDSVRVRLSQGSVASVEVDDRHALAVPDARVQELRARLEGLQAERRVAADGQVVASVTRDHFLVLLQKEESAHRDEVEKGRVNADAWEENLTYVTNGLKAAQAELRAVEKRLAELDAAIADAQTELGAAQAGEVLLRDVIVDVLADAGARLELEYLVASAGWQPQYELRTAADARSVELTYRAQVWQRTGEDWPDCALLLSTAQPQRGAEGPEPQPITVRIFDPRPMPAAPPRERLDEESVERLRAMGYVGDKGDDGVLAFQAGVENQGLSVQFRLPRKETVESRERPSTVLVGQQALQVEPEHVVVPALDTTVWLRGRTKNSTAWVMLPGGASVYFGSDFIGQGRFEKPVMPDQEFTLHLGADPGLTCERVQTQDLHEEPSFLSKRQSQVSSWRVRLENHGGHPAEPDGSVLVAVREAIPRAADDRIEVEVESESARPSEVERWRKDQDELGIRTWVLRVGPDSKADLTWTVRTTWPHDQQISSGPSW